MIGPERERSETEDMIYEYGRALFFNPQTQEFVVRNKDAAVIFPLQSAGDIGVLNTYQIPHGLNESKSDYLLVMAGFQIYVMPRLRKYMKNLEGGEWLNLRNYICTVIQKAHRRLNPTLRAPISWIGFIGINAVKRENGNFVLQTFGNSAAIGPKGYGTDPDERTSDFPQEYDLGNADTPVQRLSLYAGIGALAWVVENGLPEQKPKGYGTDPDERTSDFPQEYDLGNADTPVQRLSLYAGIGALAWVVENGLPEQKPKGEPENPPKEQQLGLVWD